MNLLFKRDQKSGALFSLVPLRIGNSVIFNLHAELELDDEEKELVKRYRLAQVPLVVSDPIDDLRQAFRPALLLGLVSFVSLWLITPTGFMSSISLALLVVLVMTVVYFRTLREQIIVSDLTEGGRTFYCESIVLLIQKEAYLERVCEYLRQVLESAKHWDDRERIAIQPLKKAEAKQAVLKGSLLGV